MNLGNLYNSYIPEPDLLRFKPFDSSLYYRRHYILFLQFYCNFIWSFNKRIAFRCNKPAVLKTRL